MVKYIFLLLNINFARSYLLNKNFTERVNAHAYLQKGNPFSFAAMTHSYAFPFYQYLAQLEKIRLIRKLREKFILCANHV